MALSYSRPLPYTWPHVTPRKLLPVFPPPVPLPAPPLPSPPRKHTLKAPYTLSTHLLPAAHLRSTDLVPVPSLPPHNLPKAEREALAVKLSQTLYDLRGSLEPRGTPRLLWNCVNRYVRHGLDAKRANSGLTLFFAHANGFPKETWEPTLQHLLSSPAAEVIDEVWTWESVQHGDSCLVNAERLGCVFDWTDNTRDILNFLIFYLPSVVSSSPLPTHLERLSPKESELRQDNPFLHRTFFAIGHSFGGCTTSLAALTKPKLFSSIMLIDPVLAKPSGVLIDIDERTDRLILGALLRRETWDSREQAFQIMSKTPFFGAWDPAALMLYLECGTYDTVDPATGKPIIRLKLSGLQEATVFRETHTRVEVYEQLPALDKSIELRWVVPGKPSENMLGPPHVTRERVWVRPDNSSNIIIPNAGHLIPQEAPQALAKDIQEFIQRRYVSPRANL